jgi:hypothetical protein
LVRKVSRNKFLSVAHELIQQNFLTRSDDFIRKSIVDYFQTANTSGSLVAQFDAIGKDDDVIRQMGNPMEIEYIRGRLRVRPKNGLHPGDVILIIFDSTFILNTENGNGDSRHLGQMMIRDTCIAYNLLSLGSTNTQFNTDFVKYEYEPSGEHVPRPNYAPRNSNSMILMRMVSLRNRDLLRIRAKLK